MLSAVGVVLVGAMSVGCGDEGDELDDSTVDDAELRAGQYTADELFWELKEIESAFPQVAESCTIEVGTLNGSTGEFTGLVTIPGYYDYEFGRYFPPIKPARNCNAVNAKLRYRVINNSGSFRVTVDGDTTYDDDGNGIIDVDIGRDKEVSWTARSGTKAFSETLKIGRPNVDGAGAFTVEAWPIVLLYEPPTNQGKTNSASFAQSTQRTSTTTLSNGSSSSHKSPPPFVSPSNLLGKLDALGSKLGANHPAGLMLMSVDNLIGTIRTEITTGTSVSSEQTIEFSTSDMLSITTVADLGPGRGDVVGYLKNARLGWVMNNGDVSATIIDYQQIVYVSMQQIRDDLAEVRRGGGAPWTGLSLKSLESLAALDPFVRYGEVANLSASRFVYDKSVQIGGVSLQVNASHTHTVTDKQTTSSFQTRVTEANAGWLSKIGFGVSQNGTTTTTLKQSSSRSVTVGQTVSTSFMLDAAANENYEVDIYYDRMFGTFAVRRPEGNGCPVFNPASPDGSFCNDPNCPCYAGEGDCDNDSHCAGDLVCGLDNGPLFGLPTGWEVCVPDSCPIFDPVNPNGSFCNDPNCPCDVGEGDCDSDSQCLPGLVCGVNNGPEYGLPVGWEVCVPA